MQLYTEICVYESSAIANETEKEDSPFELHLKTYNVIGNL
jgi:hypothetical protein